MYVLRSFEAPKREREKSTRMIYGRTRVPAAERGSKRTTARAMVSKRSTLLYGGVMDGLVISFSLSLSTCVPSSSSTWILRPQAAAGLHSISSAATPTLSLIFCKRLFRPQLIRIPAVWRRFVHTTYWYITFRIPLHVFNSLLLSVLCWIFYPNKDNVS
jgi:hypothetical protein